MTRSKWEEPPGNGTGRQAGVLRFEAEAVKLRGKPGKWLLVQTYPSGQGVTARSVGVRIRMGGYPAFRPAGAWECKTHYVEAGVGIYVRYIGEKGEYKDVRQDAEYE